MLRRTRSRDRGHTARSGSRSTPLCEHLAADESAHVPPASSRCQGCAALGETLWAHLRVCVTCGHVGCCDSSPHQHATEHHRATGHPVMRSAEPGETWRWCYVDSCLG